METARVDIRKLQLLNDRINQCLDALTQVRLTVHGLSHSGAQGLGGSPSGQFGGIGAIDPRYGGMSAQGLGGYAGIQGAQFGGQFGGQQFGGQPNVSGTVQFPLSAWGQQPGLSHTAGETESIYNRPVWADPTMANKVKETFPFVGYALPPIVALF